MPGQKFQYDESGSTFVYFLLSFLALVLIPSTYYCFIKKKKERKSKNISCVYNYLLIMNSVLYVSLYDTDTVISSIVRSINSGSSLIVSCVPLQLLGMKHFGVGKPDLDIYFFCCLQKSQRDYVYVHNAK